MPALNHAMNRIGHHRMTLKASKPGFVVGFIMLVLVCALPADTGDGRSAATVQRPLTGDAWLDAVAQHLVEGELTEQAAEKKTLDDAGIRCGTWYCVGPFKDAQFGLFSRSFNTPFGPESNLPADGVLATGPDAVFDSVALPGDEATRRCWLPMAAWKDGYWCEMPVGPLPGRNEVVYASRILTIKSGLTLRGWILVQDAAKVWLNGREVARVYGKPNTFARALCEGACVLPLQAGDNHLLIKVAAYHGRRGFALSLPPLTPVFKNNTGEVINSQTNRLRPGDEPYASTAGTRREARSLEIPDAPNPGDDAAQYERAATAIARMLNVAVEAANLPAKADAGALAQVRDCCRRLHALVMALDRLRSFHFEVDPVPGYDPPVLRMCGQLDRSRNASSARARNYLQRLKELQTTAHDARQQLQEHQPGAAAAVVAAADALDRLWDGETRSLPPIVFIRRDRAQVNVVSPYQASGPVPAEICVFDPAKPGQPPRVIYHDDTGSVYDLNLSFDAKTIFFSARRQGVEGGWHIYAMPVEATVDPQNAQALQQVTRGDSNDTSPLLLPNGEVMFVSDRAKFHLVCQNPLAGVLYVCARDGSHARRVSGNSLSDHTPQLLNDGRVLFTRWDYGVNVNVFSRQALWSINPDGTQLQLFFGNSIEDPNGFYQARAIPDRSEVICTFGPHHQFQAGSLGMVWNANGMEQPRGDGFRWVSRELPVTDDITFPHGYQQAYPVNERQFLVSYGGDGGQRNRIYLVDDRGNKRCVLEDPRFGCWWPILLEPRASPPVIPSRAENPDYVGRPTIEVVNQPDDAWGTLVLSDVYDQMAAHVARGEIKALQIMEQVPKTHPKDAPEAWGDSPIIGRGTYYVRRLIGVVPVDEDGSAHFLAPAVRDISINALDAEGRVLQMMKTTFNVMPGERTSCVGCHEHDRNAPAIGITPMALKRAPDRPQVPPEWGTDGIIDYRQMVQPVFDRHCVKCHSGEAPKGGVDLSADLTRYFNMSYNTLCDRGLVYYGNLAGEPPTKSTPKAFGAMVSTLRKYIETKHSGAILPLADRQRIYTWIDADVPFYGTYAHSSGNTQLTGFRDRWHVGTETDWFRKEFMPTFEKRCVSCHERKVDCTQPYATGSIEARVTSKVWPDWVYMSYFFGARDPIAALAGPDYRVNLTHPGWSLMLTAPLTKEAGGLGLCQDPQGAAIFLDQADADYQTLLKALLKGKEILDANPIDPPGERQ